MLEKTLTDFDQVLSSKEPVPGGGGASAYVGALGIALGEMVGSLTVGKKKYADVEADIIEYNKKAAALRKKFEELVEADAKAFYPLSQAYGMKKDTEEEKQKKELVLQKALRGATLVPLEILKTAVEALELVAQYANKGSVIAISDAGCAAAFLKASIEGARLNVLINTRLIKDEEFKNQIEAEMEVLAKKGKEEAHTIYAQVEARLK